MHRFLIALAGTSLLATPALAAEAQEAPAVQAASVDPARLAEARITVDHVFPLGTYAKIMNGSMDKMIGSMTQSMSRIPLKDLAGMSGVDVAKMGPGTTEQIMAIYDPAYKQRMQIATHTMMSQMTGIMTQFEPDIRDGMAHAYAARFDVAQLKQINAFFATPTGDAFAADYYTIMMSPEVMDKMQAFMPKLAKQMPAIVEKVKAATADLPPMRKYKDLSEADRKKLAGLLGVSEADLEKQEAAKGN